MYKKYSTVNEDMLAMRKTVLSRKQPRRMFVQGNTEIVGRCCKGWYVRLFLTDLLASTWLLPFFVFVLGDEVKLTQYPGNVSSLIESFTKRFPKHDDDLEKLWNAESSYHKY